MKNKGFSLIFSLIIIGIALAIGLSIFSLIVGGFPLAETSKNSQIAFYAANSGIERAFYEILNAAGPIYNNGEGNNEVEITLDNGASYSVHWDGEETIISSGLFRDTQRTIEVSLSVNGE
jgi:Tfp pilus assembly protein PilX